MREALVLGVQLWSAEPRWRAKRTVRSEFFDSCET
jgi:hypothetical protein